MTPIYLRACPGCGAAVACTANDRLTDCADHGGEDPRPAEDRLDRDPNVFVGPYPRHGDLIRLVRTTTEVIEGIWIADTGDCDPDHKHCSTGHSAIATRNATWMRIRDRGPIPWHSRYTDDASVADTVEVIEARNGAPFDDLMDEWGERRRARAVAEAEDRATRVRRARRESAWWFRLAQYLRADTTSKEPSDD